MSYIGTVVTSSYHLIQTGLHVLQSSASFAAGSVGKRSKKSQILQTCLWLILEVYFFFIKKMILACVCMFLGIYASFLGIFLHFCMFCLFLHIFACIVVLFPPSSKLFATLQQVSSSHLKFCILVNVSFLLSVRNLKHYLVWWSFISNRKLINRGTSLKKEYQAYQLGCLLLLVGLYDKAASTGAKRGPIGQGLYKCKTNLQDQILRSKCSPRGLN